MPKLISRVVFGILAALFLGNVKAETGLASFYGGKHHGRPMANGQIFDQMSDSCAHKSYRFGTVLKVTTRAGRSIRCVVRDRGPYRPGRIVDVSVAGARSLGMIAAGVLPVTIQPQSFGPQGRP